MYNTTTLLQPWSPYVHCFSESAVPHEMGSCPCLNSLSLPCVSNYLKRQKCDFHPQICFPFPECAVFPLYSFSVTQSYTLFTQPDAVQTLFSLGPC